MGSWYKQAASPDKILNEFGIEDNIMRYFLVNIGKNILNFNGINSKEDLYNAVNNKYQELKKNVPSKMFVNENVVKKSWRRLQGENSPFRGMETDQIVSLINSKKAAIIFGGQDPIDNEKVFGWVEEIESDPNFNSAFAYISLSYGVGTSDKKRISMPAKVNSEALMNVKRIIDSGSTYIDEGQGQATFGFASIYKNVIENIKNNTINKSSLSSSGWTRFTNGEAEELASFAEGGGWCVSGDVDTAAGYLEDGDIIIYTKMGRPSVCMHISSDDSMAHGDNVALEIKGPHNSDPVDYAPEILEFAAEEDIIIDQTEDSINLLKANDINDQIQKSPDDPNVQQKAKDNPQLIMKRNRKGIYKDIWIDGWLEKIESKIGYVDGDYNEMPPFILDKLMNELASIGNVPQEVLANPKLQNDLIPNKIVPILVGYIEQNKGSTYIDSNYPSWLGFQSAILEALKGSFSDISKPMDNLGAIPGIYRPYLINEIVQALIDGKFTPNVFNHMPVEAASSERFKKEAIPKRVVPYYVDRYKRGRFYEKDYPEWLGFHPEILEAIREKLSSSGFLQMPDNIPDIYKEKLKDFEELYEYLGTVNQKYSSPSLSSDFEYYHPDFVRSKEFKDIVIPKYVVPRVISEISKFGVQQSSYADGKFNKRNWPEWLGFYEEILDAYRSKLYEMPERFFRHDATFGNQIYIPEMYVDALEQDIIKALSIKLEDIRNLSSVAAGLPENVINDPQFQKELVPRIANKIAKEINNHTVESLTDYGLFNPNSYPEWLGVQPNILTAIKEKFKVLYENIEKYYRKDKADKLLSWIPKIYYPYLQEEMSVIVNNLEIPKSDFVHEDVASHLRENELEAIVGNLCGKIEKNPNWSPFADDYPEWLGFQPMILDCIIKAKKNWISARRGLLRDEWELTRNIPDIYKEKMMEAIRPFWIEVSKRREEEDNKARREMLERWNEPKQSSNNWYKKEKYKFYSNISLRSYNEKNNI